MFENIFVGNKAAAEDTQFLVRLNFQSHDNTLRLMGDLCRKGITHVLNLASDTTLRFCVIPDREDLERNGIELKEMKLRQERIDVT